MLSILFDVWRPLQKMVFKLNLDIEFWGATIFFCFRAFWLIFIKQIRLKNARLF